MVRDRYWPAALSPALLGYCWMLAGPPSVTAAPERGVLRVVCSANTAGVLEACGCQGDHGGGFARRETLIASLRTRENLLLIDAGNLVNTMHPNRELYVAMRELLGAMRYSVSIIGPNDLRLGEQALRQASSSGPPLVLSNVRTTSGAPIGKEWALVHAGTRSVGIIAVIDPALAPAGFSCRDPERTIGPLVRKLVAQKHQVMMVSYLPLPELRRLLTTVTGIDLVLTQVTEDVASPERVNGAWIVPLPASGRSLHDVGIRPDRRAAVPVTLARIELPPSVPGDPRITARIREYSARHRVPGVQLPLALSHESQERSQALVGEAARECGSCHKAQQEQWARSRHAHAWITLKVRGDDRRAECVGCHTTPLLVAPLGSAESGIGCNTCHGDGLEHTLHPAKKGSITRVPAATVCVDCHTSEASPHFELARYLAAVKH